MAGTTRSEQPTQQPSHPSLVHALVMHAVPSVHAVSAVHRRYYQPPKAYEQNIPGLTGVAGKPLWIPLTMLLIIVGSSLGLGFGYMTGAGWPLYAAMGGESYPPHQP